MGQVSEQVSKPAPIFGDFQMPTKFGYPKDMYGPTGQFQTAQDENTERDLRAQGFVDSVEWKASQLAKQIVSGEKFKLRDGVW